MYRELEEKNSEKQVLPAASVKEDSKKHEYDAEVDGKMLKFKDSHVTGREILEKAGFTPSECYVLYQKFKGCDFEKISADEKVNLAKPGLERFTVKDTDILHYTLDDEPETSDRKHMTANEILVAGGLNPNDYYLVEIFAGHQQKSYKDHPNEPIQLKCPGNKFISVFKGETPVS